MQKYTIQYYQEQTIILMLLAYKSSEFAAQKQWDCCTKAMRLQYTKKIKKTNNYNTFNKTSMKDTIRRKKEYEGNKWAIRKKTELKF